MRLKGFALVILAMTALIVAVSAFAAPAKQSAATITVTATEFKFKLSASSAAHGIVTFKVTNKGKLPHDFKIAGKKTPNIAPGKTATLKVMLAKGKFRYLCTITGHAAAGMQGFFTAR
jgi:uncharacterized cupredoxin-like copper-binding protein